MREKVDKFYVYSVLQAGWSLSLQAEASHSLTGVIRSRGSTPVSTVLRKSVKFFINKYISNKKTFKLKSGQYPV